MALPHMDDVMMVYDEFNPPAPTDRADSCATQHMDIKDMAADGTQHHDDKPAKECLRRPYLTRDILYNEGLWIKWALQPFDLPELIARRNRDGDMNFIHVASIYEENGVSGFGYIIRDCHGTPIVAYSEYFVTNEIEPVSESYLEMKAVDKSLEHAEKLDLKYVSMVCTSCDVAYAVHDCYSGEICGMRIKDKQDDKVTDVSVGIIEKLERRKNRDPEENHFYFHIHPEPYERSLCSAVCLVGLGADGRRVSKFELLFPEGLQKMPLAKDKLVELLKLLHTEASTPSLFHP